MPRRDVATGRFVAGHKKSHFSCDVVVNLNPFAMRQIEERIAVRWINVVQECVAEAKKRSPHDTGHNMRSINPGGAVHSSGATTIDPKNIDGEVFTTSGYGGWLEIGTHHPKKPARPYLKPAVDHVWNTKAQSILGGTL